MSNTKSTRRANGHHGAFWLAVRRRKRSRDEGYLVDSFSYFLAAGGLWKCWVTEKDNNRSVEAR